MLVSAMPLFRALLSAVTLFGGHFLNRRLDRVRQVGVRFGLILLALIGLFLALSASPFERVALIDCLFAGPFVLIGVLAAFSAVLTFQDARQPSERALRVPPRAIAGVAISLSGALLAAALLLVSGMLFASGYRTLTAAYTFEPPGPLEFLHFDVHFGGGIQYSSEAISMTERPPAPPHGRERLRGRVTLDGIRVQGLELSLILNNQYEAREIETDSRGVFEVRLPAGHWLINRVSVDEWDARPRARDLLLFSGHEPIRGNDPYLNVFSYLEGGLPVTLPMAPNALAVDLQFRDTLALIWPRHAKPRGLGGSPHASQATYSTAIIEWQPVNGASEYEVQLTRITRTANSISSKGNLRRRVTGTSLPLIAFSPEMKSQEAPPDEYDVQVYAFDGAGRLVTASEADYNRAFKLVGATRLAAEPEGATCEKPSE
jgi:hypothetical protein